MIFRSILVFAAILALATALPAGAADITENARCIGCNMRGQDLHDSNLRGSVYIGADMQNVNLRGADLRDVKFIGVNLSGGHLDGADLRGAMFTGVDFGDATLATTKVSGVRLTGVSLERAQLGTEVRTLLAQCIACDFSGADMHGMDLHGTTLIGGRFRKANLENTNFNGATLCSGHDRTRCVDLRDAIVSGADFRNVRFCEELDRICRPVTADELRRYSHNRLDGALLP
jgi:uncharacterized protein YjbI with pentapeptide repeats